MKLGDFGLEATDRDAYASESRTSEAAAPPKKRDRVIAAIRPGAWCRPLASVLPRAGSGLLSLVDDLAGCARQEHPVEVHSRDVLGSLDLDGPVVVVVDGRE